MIFVKRSTRSHAANCLTGMDGVEYTWDDNGNLLDDGVRSYTYDAANRLVQGVSGTLTTTFTYDGDGLGSVRQLADGDGDVTLAQGYTPFGVPMWDVGTATTGYGFTGER